jgi:hypothetical protein
VWIIYPKKHTGKLRIPYYDAVDEALCFGWIDSTAKRIDDDYYCQRFSPRRKKSYWSATNAARYRRLLKEGLVTEAGKRVFAARGGILEKRTGEVGAYAWHLANTMGPKPTLKRRIAWHREHQRICGCRPVPRSLKAYFTEQ